MSLILECKNLSFSYDKKSVLKDFNCKIEKGQRLSLLGQSGCGKTSFLRLCAGLERPESGEIYLRGKKVAGAKEFIEAKDRNIGYIFQNFALFEKVSVEKNIHYGCKNEDHKKEALKLIELLNLSEHLKKYPHQLSGGEKQKVALARSLALKPDIIFMDEPFSSIDPEQTKYLINEICELFSELQVTSLMVTHSVEESKLFSKDVINFNF